jgi:hypothetical protein
VAVAPGGAGGELEEARPQAGLKGDEEALLRALERAEALLAAAEAPTPHYYTPLEEEEDPGPPPTPAATAAAAPASAPPPDDDSRRRRGGGGCASLELEYGRPAVKIYSGSGTRRSRP